MSIVDELLETIDKYIASIEDGSNIFTRYASLITEDRDGVVYIADKDDDGPEIFNDLSLKIIYRVNEIIITDIHRINGPIQLKIKTLDKRGFWHWTNHSTFTKLLMCTEQGLTPYSHILVANMSKYNFVYGNKIISIGKTISVERLF